VQKKTNPLKLNASKQGQPEKNSNLQSKQSQTEVSSEFRQELTRTLSVAIDLGYWEWNEVENKPAYLSDEMAVILDMTPVALSEMYQYEVDYFHLVHPHTFDYRIVRPSGEVRYVRKLEYGVLVDDGIVLKTFGAIQDITGYRESLQDSEQRYGSLFTQLPLGVSVLDYSVAKTMVDELLSAGINDLKIYFKSHPDLLRKIIEKGVTMIGANQALLDLYGCSSFESLVGRFQDSCRLKLKITPPRFPFFMDSNELRLSDPSF
jgi:PAS domain-containing protein